MAFMEWAGADYATIRARSAQATSAEDLYWRYRFNPLRIYPMVRPEVGIEGLSSEVVFAPVPRFLYARVTLGPFHVLYNRYQKSGKQNPFRTAMGFAVQAYVLRLLREALTASEVLDEWKYGTGKDLDTPDCIVIEGDRAVVLEVKRSSLLQNTRQKGFLDLLREDLLKWVGKAVGQLAEFRDAVSNGVPGLECVRGLKFQFAVVTFDDLEYGNSIVRDQLPLLKEELGVAALPHVHIITIEALEQLLAVSNGSSLFDILDEKRRDPDADRMDFSDWLAYRRSGGIEPLNAFLIDRSGAFFRRRGILEAIA